MHLQQTHLQQNLAVVLNTQRLKRNQWVAELPALRSLTIQLPTVGGWDGDAAQKWDSFSGEALSHLSFDDDLPCSYFETFTRHGCVTINTPQQGNACLEPRRPQPAPGAAGLALQPRRPAARLADSAVQ
jgi:hypothetical protein